MNEEKLVKILTAKDYTISAMESCTGGLFSAAIVSISGASLIFNQGFIAYSNEAKISLGVSKKIIYKYGAVSEDVALDMAECAQHKANAEIGVGISGIAGPTGGSSKKPVGMVCVGIKIKEQSYQYTFHFPDSNRIEVQKKTVDMIILKLIELLDRC